MGDSPGAVVHTHVSHGTRSDYMCFAGCACVATLAGCLCFCEAVSKLVSWLH